MENPASPAFLSAPMRGLQKSAGGSGFSLASAYYNAGCRFISEILFSMM